MMKVMMSVFSLWLGVYKIPVISPGLTYLQNGFWVDL